MHSSSSLIQALKENFNLDELREICLHLQIDSDDFLERKTPFVTDLFKKLETSNRLVELTEICNELRPRTDWNKLLSLYYSPRFTSNSKSFSNDQLKAYCELISKQDEISRWANTSTTDFYIQSEGKYLPVFAAPYDGDNRYSEFLVPLVRSRRFLIVLGEPGTGKSVALRRVVWELADNFVERIPVYVSLLSFEGNIWNLFKNAINQVGVIQLKNEHSTKLFLQEIPCHILLDGLNEIPGEYAVQALRAIRLLMSEYKQHQYTVTSRTQDRLWRKLIPEDVTQHAVVIQRISDHQTKEYLEAHLGYYKGREVFDRLNERMRDLARTPFLLWLIKEAGQDGREIPGNRGELFDSFVEQIIYRDMRLESNLDLWAENKAMMIDSLAYLAYQLQMKNKLVCSYMDARQQILDFISENNGNNSVRNTGILNKKTQLILQDSLMHGLLKRVEGSNIQYMHQSLHEYFVARYSQIILNRERLDGSIKSKWKKMIRGNLVNRANDERWADSFVQLAGIEKNPSLLVLEILPINPWLAFWCSIEGKKVDEDTQNKIEARTTDQLSSPHSAKRIYALNELGRIRNPRTKKYILPLLADKDTEVQDLASSLLVELGESTVGSLFSLLFASEDKYDVNARWAAFRTLGRMWNKSDIELLGSKYSYDRRKAAEHLQLDRNSRNIPLLLATLRDNVVEVRESAVGTLVVYKGAVVVKMLIKSLKSSDWKIQEGAAKALGRLGEMKAVDHLILALKNNNHKFVLIATVGALADIGDKRALKYLYQSLENNEHLVRIKIQQAINRLLWN